MQASDNPICESADVDCHILVDLVTPGREELAIFVEAVDRLLTELADKVNSGLEIEPLLVHDDADHIVSISF